MLSFSKQIAPNLQLLCDVCVSKKVDKLKNEINAPFNVNDLIKNKYIALIDTGANHSCITDRISKILELNSITNAEVVNTSGVVKVPVYEVCLYIPTIISRKQINAVQSQETIDIKGFLNIQANEIKYSKQNVFDVIIGMDIISKGHLTVVGGIFHFSF